MPQIIIDIDADSNGVNSDIGINPWNVARTDDPAKEVTNYVCVAVGAIPYQCSRFFGFFDMSGIPTGSKIDSATLVHPDADNHTSAAGGSVNVVEHVASDPIGVDDFLNYKVLNGDTSFGSVNYSSINTSGTTDFTLNASGITYLESVIGGIAKIGLRSSFDINNSAPGAADSGYNCTVTDFDLIINYTPPSAGILFMQKMMSLIALLPGVFTAFNQNISAMLAAIFGKVDNRVILSNN